MAVTFAVDNVLGNPSNDFRRGIYIGTLTFSGSYVTGGDALSFAAAGVLSNVAPIRVEVYEQPSTSQTATGYQFVYAKGTTSANGKLQIFSTQGTQLAASAYSTTFATTIVKAAVYFPLGQ
jgi:hypothetical protein